MKKLRCIIIGLSMLVCGASIADGQDATVKTEGATAAEPIPYGMQNVETPRLKKSVFDNMRLKFGGWVAQSYTFNTDSPSDRLNAARVFDDRSNDYRFNQFLVYFERELSDGKDFDIGGRVELMYGSDARFIHQKGLADNIDDNTVQFDPVQFYALLRAPIGNGLTFKVGKYATTLGAEVINAPDNALFSRSYLFGYAIPFTHTGVQANYPISDNLGIYYGLVKGWDVWNDNNNALSHMIGIYGSSPDEKFSHWVNLITGPEADDNSSDYRTVLDIGLGYLWTERLSQTINIDYGIEKDAAPGGGDAGWWGIANYFTYTFNPELASTLRFEYFRDDDGTRLGYSADMYEVTFGLDIRPEGLTNVRFRPEIRWDHAAGATPFDGGSDGDQVTLAMDIIFTF
jgi:hypothetical protein